MNEKFKKKKVVSTKSIAFWSVIGLIILVLITLLIVRVAETRDVNSYSKVDMLKGSEIFNQEDSQYYVLFYDFEENDETESFNKGVFKYLTYVRNTSSASKLFGMDSDEYINQMCFSTTNNISSANKFPSELNKIGSTGVLSVSSDSLPILFVVKDGAISEFKTGENEILNYLTTTAK